MSWIVRRTEIGRLFSEVEILVQPSLLAIRLTIYIIAKLLLGNPVVDVTLFKKEFSVKFVSVF